MGTFPPGLSDWALRYVAKTVRARVLETPSPPDASTPPARVQLLLAFGTTSEREGRVGLNSSRWARTIQWKPPPAGSMASSFRLVCRSGRGRHDDRGPWAPTRRPAEGRTEDRELPARGARDPRRAAWTAAPECPGAGARGRPDSCARSASGARGRVRRPDLPSPESAPAQACPRPPGASRP